MSMCYVLKRYLNFWMRYSSVKICNIFFCSLLYFFHTYIFVKVSLYKVLNICIVRMKLIERTMIVQCTYWFFPFYCTRIVVASRFECVLIIDANIFNKKLYEWHFSDQKGEGDEDEEDPIMKAEKEFFQIIKEEQDSRLEQRRQKPDGDKDLEWKMVRTKKKNNFKCTFQKLKINALLFSIMKSISFLYKTFVYFSTSLFQTISNKVKVMCFCRWGVNIIIMRFLFFCKIFVD